MNPENRKLVLIFSGVLLVGGVVSLKTGVTYFRRQIHRDDEPTNFWTSVTCLFALGVFLLTGALITD